MTEWMNPLTLWFMVCFGLHLQGTDMVRSHLCNLLFSLDLCGNGFGSKPASSFIGHLCYVCCTVVDRNVYRTLVVELEGSKKPLGIHVVPDGREGNR